MSDSNKINPGEMVGDFLSMAGMQFQQFEKDIRNVVAILFKEGNKKGQTQQELSAFFNELIVKIYQSVGSQSFKESIGRFVLMLMTQKGTFDKDFEMDAAFYVTMKPLFDFLYKDYWRVTVKGQTNIPKKGAGLIVSNHSGTLPYDGMMIRLSAENRKVSPRDVRFLVDDFLFELPFLGGLMERIGGVRSSPENATRLLKKKKLIAVFPEGVRGVGKPFKDRYQLQRFGRGGYIKLALKNRTPIIPTAVMGAEEIHPMLHNFEPAAKYLNIPYFPITPTFPFLGLLGMVPLPTKWSIFFGKPIHFRKHKAKDANNQKIVDKLSLKVTTQIQKMIDDGLKKRRSIWFG